MNNVISIRDARCGAFTPAVTLRLVLRVVARAARPAPLVMAWIRDPMNGELVARWSQLPHEDCDGQRSSVAPFSLLPRSAAPRRCEETLYGRRV